MPNRELELTLVTLNRLRFKCAELLTNLEADSRRSELGLRKIVRTNFRARLVFIDELEELKNRVL